MRVFTLALCAGLAAASPAVAQNRVMVINSTAGTVMLFDRATGTLLNPTFIQSPTTPATFSTPKGVCRVQDEVWVADQVRDAIFRFDLQGTFLSLVGAPPALGGPGGLDNIRGLNFIQGTIYQTNSGVQNSAPGNGIVRFDTSGNNLGFFAAGSSPFDVVEFNGELLVSDSSLHTIARYALDGTPLGVFHSGAIRFPQQIAFRANGNLIVGGFSPPSGIYELDPSGNQVAFYAAAGVRGVFELDNGNILYTNGSGVHIYDVTLQSSTQVTTGGSQYISLLDVEFEPPCYANCDASTVEPILNIDDFTCFINEFAAAQILPHEQQVTHYANCDGSTVAPALNIDDFTCFINEFATGCP